LRVSPKGDKSSPRIVYRYGRQDREIRQFLAYRELIKGITGRANDAKIHTNAMT